MSQTPQCDSWDHTARELETLWPLTERGNVARRVLYTHPLGGQARVDSGDILPTQVCRSDNEIEQVAAGLA